MRVLLAAAVLLSTAACAQPAWQRAESIDRTNITKIETPLAPEFCSALFGPNRRACAVRLTAVNKCVIVTLPSDTEAMAHESVHCLGFDHPER